MITVSIKMFNSVGRFAPGKRYFKLALPYNETIGEVIKQLKVPEKELRLLAGLVAHGGSRLGASGGPQHTALRAEGDVGGRSLVAVPCADHGGTVRPRAQQAGTTLPRF